MSALQHGQKGPRATTPLPIRVQAKVPAPFLHLHEDNWTREVSL